MIFVLHYLLFNAGLPAVIILIALFLQTYSDASLSEIGTLLMALPFVSILIKPLFGALADRHNAHRHYLMASLGFMALGYGSLAIAPFFPDFIKQHGRLVWYLDILGIIVGYSAFGIIWSLGDALAVNGAQMAGVSWGFYRMWGVISWGTVGIFVGQINEVPFLPKYVPAFFVLIFCLVAEIILLAFWPNKYFVMCGSLESPASEMPNEIAIQEDGDKMAIVSCATQTNSGKDPSGLNRLDSITAAEMEAHWPANRSLTGTMTAGTLGRAASPRMIGAVANIFMEDLGGTLKSSLKLGGPSKTPRMGLDEILEQYQTKLATSEQQPAGGAKPPGTSFGRATLRRMMGLGEVGGVSAANQQQQQQQPLPASPNSGTPVSTLGKAAALRAAGVLEKTATGNTAASLRDVSPLALAVAKHRQDQDQPDRNTIGTLDDGLVSQQKQTKSAEDLQLVLLKLIIMRDKTIGKYMALFTLFGFLLTCHLSYFYLHLERLCREKNNDFSSVMGGMLATHSISEVLSFMAVPRYIGRVGRVGGLLTCALAYFVRFAYYGTYFVENSPYTGVPFEFCHGIAYGIVYTLITDIACECVDQVDEFLPELLERGLVEPDIQLSRLKSALRATMQGVFSGAFDGLGNGLGALFGGVFLDAYSFTSLWKFCALISLAIMVIYPMTEWRTLTASRRPNTCCGSSPPMKPAPMEEKPKLAPEAVAPAAK